MILVGSKFGSSWRVMLCFLCSVSVNMQSVGNKANKNNVLCLSSLGINLSLVHGAEIRKHLGLGSLSIVEDISALLGEDSRDAIEEVALQTQGEGRTGVDDSLACLGDVDLLNDLSV